MRTAVPPPPSTEAPEGIPGEVVKAENGSEEIVGVIIDHCHDCGSIMAISIMAMINDPSANRPECRRLLPVAPDPEPAPAAAIQLPAAGDPLVSSVRNPVPMPGDPLPVPVPCPVTA